MFSDVGVQFDCRTLIIANMCSAAFDNEFAPNILTTACTSSLVRGIACRMFVYGAIIRDSYWPPAQQQLHQPSTVNTTIRIYML